MALWYVRTTQTAPTTETTAAAEPDFAEVVVTDLVETSEYEGTLGRLDGDPINVRLDGTVTALPEEGTTLEQGDVIAWVDNQPVVLLYGELPGLAGAEERHRRARCAPTGDCPHRAWLQRVR